LKTKNSQVCARILHLKPQKPNRLEAETKTLNSGSLVKFLDKKFIFLDESFYPPPS